jgi:uncharacterized membrane protein
MNDAHIHLVLNHLPVLLGPIGLLTMTAGFIVRSEVLKRSAYCLFMAGAIFAILAYLSGEGAEEIIENIDAFSEQYINKHEQAAYTFSIVAYLNGVLSSIGIWLNWKRKSMSNTIGITVMILSLTQTYYAKQAATTGGEIRHTEIRTNATIIEYEFKNSETKSE